MDKVLILQMRKMGARELTLRSLSWPVAELFLATFSLAFPYEPESLTIKLWIKRAYTAPNLLTTFPYHAPHPTTLPNPKLAHLPREGPTSL